jgi:hypothetical protein
LTSVLLIVLLSSINGCATNKFIPCETPELRGDTYQDIIILSLEQAVALDECNLVNGTYDYVPNE